MASPNFHGHFRIPLQVGDLQIGSFMTHLKSWHMGHDSTRFAHATDEADKYHASLIALLHKTLLEDTQDDGYSNQD